MSRIGTETGVRAMRVVGASVSWPIPAAHRTLGEDYRTRGQDLADTHRSTTRTPGQEIYRNPG